MTAILAILFFSSLICGLAAEERVATNQPRFISKGANISVKEGNDIELECLVDDLGEFVILWKFNRSQVLFAGNLRIHRDDRISRIDNSGSLLIKQFRAENSGEYSCQLSTNPPQDIHYLVEVLGPPTIHNSPSEIVVRKSEKIDLKCETNTETIEWRKDSKLLSNEKHLIIKSAKPEDSGAYQCIASNQIGQSSHQFRVRVLYEPQLEASSTLVHAPIGQPITIECLVRADPQANVNWFRSSNQKVLPNERVFIDRQNATTTLRINSVLKEDYDQYSCLANNSLGSAIKVIHLTGRPSIPVVTSAPLAGRTNKYRLQWVLQSETPITKYDIKWRSRDQEEWQTLSVEPLEESSEVEKWQTFEVTQLEEDHNYEVMITAHNEYGMTSSDIFSFVTSWAQMMSSKVFSVFIVLFLTLFVNKF